MEEVDGSLEPRIKLSENIWKITNPGYKKVVRIYSKLENKALADLIMLDDEKIDESKPLTIFSPTATWKTMTLTNYYIKDLMQPIFVEGKQVYQSPSLMEIQAYAQEQLNTLWDEYKRFTNPHIYKVDLSQKLYDLKNQLIRSNR